MNLNFDYSRNLEGNLLVQLRKQDRQSASVYRIQQIDAVDSLLDAKEIIKAVLFN